MEENDLVYKPMTNEETKAAVDMPSSQKTPSEVGAPTQTTPQPTGKEVKPVAEVKDPEGMFDYTGCQTYVVKEGETLFDVAQQYNVALQQLRYFNHVSKATMYIKTGQTLYIPKEPVHVPAGK
ncbi:LysM peptidoglycan-binding domain-containing protein [Lactobacillus helveticus]|uniref:LysM peptidoglycan-binding domain-containing protein n=1 Tax=Lactobacillus helveticus TaxID=1587 RepID=UPI00062ABC3F|nr:LysM domain-containing protein [Lactobacillus helveticus]AKG66641.1 hypothetical protein TU99_04805 [Lactobacillus helveticus]